MQPFLTVGLLPRNLTIHHLETELHAFSAS